MTWKAPEVTPVDEPSDGDERLMLEGFLDRERTGLLMRCAGLGGDQLAQRAVPPSNLSLLGLIRHLTDVERKWFRRRFAGEVVKAAYVASGDLDPHFDLVDPATAPDDYAALLDEWRVCRQVVADMTLDQTYSHQRFGTMTLRWLYLHMTREYAGHCGHADFLRERIDGGTFG